MDGTAILVISLIAFLSAPAAFVLTWILYRQTGDRAARELAFTTFGTALILLGNLLTVLAEGSARPLRYGIYILLLNQVALSTIVTGAFVARFAHRATQLPIGSFRSIVFWTWAVVLHALAIAEAVLSHAGMVSHDIAPAFSLVTLGSVLVQLYATIVIVVRRRHIPSDFFVPHLARYFLFLLPLVFLAAANDVFQLGPRFGGDGIPFSPIFTLLIDGFIIAVVGKRLVSQGSHAVSVKDLAADHELTLRETDVLSLLVEGASNNAIGESLHISPHTVKNHVSVIFRKIGVSNRFELLKSFSRKES